MQDLLSRASRHITEKYGRGEPRYDFVMKTLQDKPYERLLADLSAKWSVVDDTDPNDDVSFNWIVSDDQSDWRIAVSMVGPFALLIRAGQNGTAHVISSENDVRQLAELEMMQLIRASGLELMSRNAIRLQVPATAEGMEGLSLYEALFTDSDSLPE